MFFYQGPRNNEEQVQSELNKSKKALILCTGTWTSEQKKD